MAGQRVTSVDVHIGSRIRMRRMMVGMTQEQLGDALGVTFQQLQKYEKGVNGTRGSRLLQLAKALKVPVSYFFEGAPGSSDVPDKVRDDFTSEFLTDRQGLALASAFLLIIDPAARAALLASAQAFATASRASKIKSRAA